jgi:3',5'-cyclic AMP phosphodiesterase CpdA
VNLWEKVVSRLTHWKGGPAHSAPLPRMGDEPLVHLAIAGDVGRPGPHLDAIGAAIAKIGKMQPYDALLLLGDNVYPRGDPRKLPETVFKPFGTVLDQGAALLAILGNHDVKDGNGPEQLRVLGMECAWWSRRFGDVLVVGLDSHEVENDAQHAWLEETLANSDARWKIVAVHDSPYSAGYQGSNLRVRERWAPLFARHGVQLVFSGHDHDYQRSHPIDGVTYVISGGAARTRRSGARDFTAVSFKWHHFVDVQVFADRLELRAVNAELLVGDERTFGTVSARE